MPCVLAYTPGKTCLVCQLRATLKMSSLVRNERCVGRRRCFGKQYTNLQSGLPRWAQNIPHSSLCGASFVKAIKPTPVSNHWQIALVVVRTSSSGPRATAGYLCPVQKACVRDIGLINLHLAIRHCKEGVLRRQFLLGSQSCCCCGLLDSLTKRW
jgi:hypothetical protein